MSRQPLCWFGCWRQPASKLPLIGAKDGVVAMAVGADRVVQNHPAVGPAFAVPMLHEVVINFALNMGG